MAVVFNGRKIVAPGGASRIDAEGFGGFEPGAKGTIALVGEAEAGEPGTVLQFSDPETMERYFRAGPLADAARIAFKPLNDNRVQAGAQIVLCVVANQNTASAKNFVGTGVASGVVTSGDGPYDLRFITLTAFLVVAIDGGSNQSFNLAAVAGFKTGVGGTFSGLDGTSLGVSVDGGSEQTITFDSSATDAASTAAFINAHILGAKASVSGGQIVITSDRRGTSSTVTIVTANSAAGFASTGAGTTGTGDVANLGAVTAAEIVALVDATLTGATIAVSGDGFTITSDTSGGSSSVEVKTASTADGVLGLDNNVHTGNAAVNTLTLTTKEYGLHTKNTYVSISIPSTYKRTVAISYREGVRSRDESMTTDGLAKFSIYYTGSGTSPKISLTDSDNDGLLDTLTTSITGVGADQLSLDLTQYASVYDLVAAINNFQVSGTAKYVAAVVDKGAQYSLSPQKLDSYASSAIGTNSGTATSIYAILDDVITKITNESQLVDATVYAASGQRVPPSAASSVQLTGGAIGASTNTNWSEAFSLLRDQDVPQVVAVADADGSSGTYGSSYTIDTVLTQLEAHAELMSRTGSEAMERTGYGAIYGAKSVVTDKTLSLNSGHICVATQRPTTLGVGGVAKKLGAWACAVAAAAARAGMEDGEPLTAKMFAFTALDTHVSWSTTEEADVSEMLEKGVLIFKKIKVGIKCVDGLTTYTRDANDVFRKESIYTNVKDMTKSWREFISGRYTGRRGTLSRFNSVKSDSETYWGGMRDAGRIVDSVENGAITKYAFRKLKLTAQGNKTFLNVEISPVEGIDYTLFTVAATPATVSI